MAHYRIHLLRQGNGATEQLAANCASDKEACELAQRLLTGHSQAEVWSGTRSLGLVLPASTDDIVKQGSDWLAGLT